MKLNKEKKIIIVLVIVIILLLVGMSYAWLYVIKYGEKDMNIVVGDIELVLNETNEGIQLVNTIPTYDDEGKAGEPYTFTLKNNSAIPLYYTLGVVDDEEAISACETDSGGSCELLDSRDVRYELKMGDRTFTGTLSDSYIMSYGIIDADEEVDCELRIWLNINANNEAIGKVFLGKLKVFASQQVADADFDQGTDNVNAPVMDDNMIAVKHDGYNWVKTDTANNWYNYDMGIWANAVTVKSDKLAEYQSAAVGTTINMDDIETMWVWIPRYSYTIASENGGASYYGKKGIYLDTTPSASRPGEIDIKFIDTNTKDTGNAKYLATETPKNYRTPDAFTYDGEELPGIWVGKFETSSSNPLASFGGSNDTTLDPMIKPNVTSWRNIYVSNIHTVATKVSAAGNRYGFSESMNSHAMKNSEWGVVAYLSQSRYGKLGNENFAGADKEIYQNKSDSYITGCSYGIPSNGNTDYGCQYTYDNNVRDETGLTGKGVGASTTGTIYGVYDMSGGAWEYVIGNYNDTIGSSGFSSMPESKYYDKYTSSTVSTACNGGECLSHGLSETAGWYSDYQNMIDAEFPWFGRGGDYANINAGVFYFNSYNGSAGSGRSFRLVMSPNM
ncbi:MAG TPA: hypothetical protein IAB45_03000 [Candidatus Onthousia faecavium]|nr:hypothetical protein [Candidatus Onthousia faecavium]